MPTLMVDDLSPQLYAVLARRASKARRSVSEEAKQILTETLASPADSADNYPVPDLIPHQEISPPCDLPRPEDGRQVSFDDGGLRLPDPFQDVDGGAE